MDDQVFLAWNLPNWITVVLMVALGYLVLAVVSQLAMRRGLLPGFGGQAQPGGYPGLSSTIVAPGAQAYTGG